MAENGEKEDKFDAFTAAGESLGYISLDQARVLAMRTAREVPGAYGRSFRNVTMAFEVVSSEETEDHYVVTMSLRPEGEFAGNPGQEQFFIEKEGTVAHRQVLAVPSRQRRAPLIPVAIGLVIAVVVVAVVLGSGLLDGKSEESPGVAAPVATAAPTVTSAMPAPPATAAPASAPTAVLAQVPVRTPAETGTTGSTTIIPETVHLDGLKQLLMEEIRKAAPQLDQRKVEALTSEALIQAEATGKSRFQRGEVAEFAKVEVDNLLSRASGEGQGTTGAIRPTGPTLPPVSATDFPQPVLRVAFPGPDAPSLKPRNRSLEGLIPIRPMFEYLVDVDPLTGVQAPMLAQQWESSEDQRRWVFHLQQGVQFHYGWGELTAKDVVYSLEALMGEKSQAKTAPFWREVLVEVLDEGSHRVKFVLNRPEPDLPRFVSSEFDLMILSKAQWGAERSGGTVGQLAGTGPYQLVEHKTGKQLLFVAVEDHYRRVPEFEELVMYVIPEPASRAAALRDGKVHIAQVPESDQRQLENAGLGTFHGQLREAFVAGNPKVVNEYAFPGNIAGVLTHLEYVKATR